MMRIWKALPVIVSVLIATALCAQNTAATQKFSDEKTGYSLLYPKGFKVKKTKTGAEITSKDKALVVTVKVYNGNDLAAIAKKESKPTADSLDVLNSVLSELGVIKELDRSLNSLPDSILEPAKAESGSIIKYDLKKKNARFVCRSLVFARGEKMVAISYTISEKKGNEKYEKTAADILRSFAFTE